ncbi:MAG TPA: AsnC family transcriptional regulator [Chloroflexota bacterium]
MDELDRRLLNIIQSDFPLVARPFAALGERLGTDEADVIGRIARLKAEKIIRQISAIFDTRSLGYKSSLVAVKAGNRVAEAARIINEHPGVSHNYERDHEFNLWYTIAVPPTSSLEEHVQRLHELSGAESSRMLPTLRLFKIGVELDMVGDTPITATASKPAYSDRRRPPEGAGGLTPLDIAVIRELQEDVALEPRPFLAAGERTGLGEEGLFAHAAALQERGYLRRYAAILYHRRAGFRANPMAVWAVPEDRVAEVGPKMAAFQAVSHCYQRPVYPDWPYNVFTMIHGRSKEDCEQVIAAISDATGITHYRALYSVREWKKTRVRYYTPEYEAWEAKYLAKVG